MLTPFHCANGEMYDASGLRVLLDESNPAFNAPLVDALLPIQFSGFVQRVVHDKIILPEYRRICELKDADMAKAVGAVKRAHEQMVGAAEGALAEADVGSIGWMRGVEAAHAQMSMAIKRVKTCASMLVE
jgi:hypothetical protein